MSRAESALKFLESQLDHPSGIDFKLRNVVASGYVKTRDFDAAIRMLDSVFVAGQRPCMKTTTMMIHLLGRAQQTNARAVAKKAIKEWKLTPDALFCESLDHVFGLKGASLVLTQLQVDENLARSTGMRVLQSERLGRRGDSSGDRTF